MPKRKILHFKRILISIALTVIELDERLRFLSVLKIWTLIDRRISNVRIHWVGVDRRRVPRPGGLFPELAARSMVLIISGGVMWVTTWAIYFVSQGWSEALIMIPLFVAWVLFVLFFRGVRLRLDGMKLI